MMNSKILKAHIFRGTWFKCMILKVFLFALAMSLFGFIQVANVLKANEPLAMNLDECPLNIGSKNLTGILKPISAFAYPLIGPFLILRCKESENFTINVFKELMEKNLLSPGEKALCVGEGSASAVWSLKELGISYALGVQKHPFFSLFRRGFVYELEFKDDHFDFVYSRGLDRVSVPALLVLEIERVLRPGGIGAILVGALTSSSGNLIRSATPVSSFLRSSDVVHVCGVGHFTLVIFKKRYENAVSFGHYQLPHECPSIASNKPFMKYVEPLVDQNEGQLGTKVSYLSNFLDISSRKRLIYISIGVGDSLNSNVAKLYKSYYSSHLQALHYYVVDHNITVLSSLAKYPGFTFVYHPGLAGDSNARSLDSCEDFDDEEYIDAPPDEREFDFVHWFEETRADGDFVVFLINGGEMELKIVGELFKSGAICHVDELFLRCSDNADCMSTLRGLRSSGVFVHQWWGD